MVDMIQSGYIAELNHKIEAQQKEIDELKAQIEMLSKWVLYLKDKNDNPNSNDASDSEALHN
jgi:uncharacterized coiled-coil protein SlyX